MSTDLRIIHAQALHIDIIADMWQAINAHANEQRTDTAPPFGGPNAQKQQHTKELIKHAIASPQAVVLIAEHKGKAIGTISGHVFTKPAVVLSHVGVVYSLWVDQDYRRQGVGQELLNTLEAHLSELGASALQVGWDTVNDYAAQWWQARGYSAYETIASKQISF